MVAASVVGRSRITIRGGGELASFLGYDADALAALLVPVFLALKISYGN